MIMIMVYYDVMYKFHLQTTIVTVNTIYIYYKNIMYLTLSEMVPLYLRRSSVQLLVVKASDPYSLLCDPRDIALAADPRNPAESKRKFHKAAIFRSDHIRVLNLQYVITCWNNQVMLTEVCIHSVGDIFSSTDVSPQFPTLVTVQLNLL